MLGKCSTTELHPSPHLHSLDSVLWSTKVLFCFNIDVITLYLFFCYCFVLVCFVFAACGFGASSGRFPHCCVLFVSYNHSPYAHTPLTTERKSSWLSALLALSVASVEGWPAPQKIILRIPSILWRLVRLGEPVFPAQRPASLDPVGISGKWLRTV